ncbi:hypothetical protein Pmani_029793 [Petrolisthes manimaculis]|uniref:2',3'-cyclic-nucleotide 3'-phosphodiesterase n=1 Tax=Petrolisthes manimaculis TaxID=1843537 RepID=A0AAE1NYQ9_9EUCA|nr:hypothetical protein Pmani_029793 [Petrolisthes manimaculis]
MSWLWRCWCHCCGTKREEEEDQEEICSPVNSNSSHVADSESSQNSEDMGKVFSRLGLSRESEDQAASKPLTVDAEEVTPNDVVVPQSTISVVHPPKSATTPIPPVPSSPHYPLATPRSPLRRSLEDATTPGSSPTKPPEKRMKGDLQDPEIPILCDDHSIDYIQQSKVMLIMKGLPGSGKSYLADRICRVYQNVVVCSADKYFMQDGEYKFDREKLKEAHENSQQTAKDAAERNTPVIIIDNTNVRNWEMGAYLGLARDFLYTPLVLEAQTPWAFDPQELTLRNKHGVPKEILVQKVKSYQPVQPLYYGWFLNEADSWKLCDIAKSWLQAAINVEQFYKDLSHHFDVVSPEELLRTYSRQTYRDGGSILHCTANFTARGKDESSREYINNPIVKSAMGKCFPLHVIGFIITPRTFGVRLRLTVNQLDLWGQDDTETVPSIISHPHEPKKHKRNEPTEKKTDKENDIRHSLFSTTPLHSSCTVTITQLNSLSQADQFHPTSGKGSRAHITMGCAPGVKPVTTGFDLIDIVRREKEAQSSLTDVLETFTLPGGTLRNYGEGSWALYLDKELQISSLFSAYYG